MEKYSQKTSEKGIVNEELIPRPSQNRNKSKSSLRENINLPELSFLKQQANEIYHKYKLSI